MLLLVVFFFPDSEFITPVIVWAPLVFLVPPRLVLFGRTLFSPDLVPLVTLRFFYLPFLAPIGGCFSSGPGLASSRLPLWATVCLFFAYFECRETLHNRFFFLFFWPIGSFHDVSFIGKPHLSSMLSFASTHVGISFEFFVVYFPLISMRDV